MTHDGVRRFADYKGEVRTSCDVVVVGSGPTGAVAAKVLAEAGKDVIVVEEGPPFSPADFTPDAGDSMYRMMRECGLRTTRGNIYMPTIQAIGLGGGSLVNSAICVRAPDWVFDKWMGVSGDTGIDASVLSASYQRIEDFWRLEKTPDAIMGPRNLAFLRGCEALGISCEPIVRNAHGCKGSSECFSGCRNGAKQSVDVAFLPAAMARGARVLSGIRVERIEFSGRRAVAVNGHVVSPTYPVGEVLPLTPSHSVRIEAKSVVLAAGCMASPIILQRSGVVGNWIGEALQFHPGLAIMAVFSESIKPWTGATQGAHSLQFLKEGMKLEVLWAPPAVLATRLPGFGAEFKANLRSYEYMAPFDVFIAAEHSRGRVRAKRTSFEPDIYFRFGQEDQDLLIRGMSILSDIAWAAGAIEILPGIHGLPERLRSKQEAEVLRTARVPPSATLTAANHAFGSLRLSKRAEDGAVDEWGRVHSTDNVYVVDTSVFPGSPAVNPMLTGMALAERFARAMAGLT